MIAFSSSITVLDPNGGESWAIGSTKTIRWDSSGVSGNIIIKLLKNGTMLGSIDWNVQNTGNYSWKINDIAGTPITPGNDYKVLVRSFDDHSIEDQSDATFRIIENVDKPDLYFKDHRFQPKPIYTGDIVSFEATIDNGGNINSTPCKATFKVFGPKGFQTLQFNFDIPERSPGQTIKIHKNYRVTRWGFYKHTVKLDADNKNNESNEDNNEKNFWCGVAPLPDLIVCIRDGGGTNNVTKTKLWVSVRNIGETDSKPCKLRWYIKENGVVWRDVPSLDPGEHIVFYRHAKWYTKGRKGMVAIVDYNNQVNELKEDNNKVEGSIKVFLSMVEFDTSGLARKKCSDQQ